MESFDNSWEEVQIVSTADHADPTHEEHSDKGYCVFLAQQVFTSSSALNNTYSFKTKQVRLQIRTVSRLGPQRVLYEEMTTHLERALLHADGRDGVEVTLDPLPDHVGLLRELTAQSLVVLLTDHLLLQRRVALRHQLPHLLPLGRDVLQCNTQDQRLKPTGRVGVVLAHREIGWAGEAKALKGRSQQT